LEGWPVWYIRVGRVACMGYQGWKGGLYGILGLEGLPVWYIGIGRVACTVYQGWKGCLYVISGLEGLPVWYIRVGMVACKVQYIRVGRVACMVYQDWKGCLYGNDYNRAGYRAPDTINLLDKICIKRISLTIGTLQAQRGHTGEKKRRNESLKETKIYIETKRRFRGKSRPSS
jgi:hypothetical protein